VLLRCNPFEHDDTWGPLFLVRLVFHNPVIELDRTKTAPERAPPPGREYGCAIDYDGNASTPRSTDPESVLPL